MQWFLQHDEYGRPQVKPFDGDMVGSDAKVDVAVRFILWAGENFPSMDWQRKANKLVRSCPPTV